ncbi:MAG TPA: hypothetical protein VD967_01160 [Candidatus Paceibacterota bacterium]|nr:hypothetical protein [Candidatus Paceibacterota bacterium]
MPPFSRLIAERGDRAADLHDASKLNADHHEIQVSDLKVFPGNRWREAILCYLFGVWGDNDVMHCPKIDFGGVTLRLEHNRYFAYGTAPDTEPLTLGFLSEKLDVDNDKAEVEVGLASFVKNDKIRVFTIMLPDQGLLRFWKTERRGEYGCSGYRLPPA